MKNLLIISNTICLVFMTTVVVFGQSNLSKTFKLKNNLTSYPLSSYLGEFNRFDITTDLLEWEQGRKNVQAQFMPLKKLALGLGYNSLEKNLSSEDIEFTFQELELSGRLAFFPFGNPHDITKKKYTCDRRGTKSKEGECFGSNSKLKTKALQGLFISTELVSKNQVIENPSLDLIENKTLNTKAGIGFAFRINMISFSLEYQHILTQPSINQIDLSTVEESGIDFQPKENSEIKVRVGINF